MPESNARVTTSSKKRQRWTLEEFEYSAEGEKIFLEKFKDYYSGDPEHREADEEFTVQSAIEGARIERGGSEINFIYSNQDPKKILITPIKPTETSFADSQKEKATDP